MLTALIGSYINGDFKSSVLYVIETCASNYFITPPMSDALQHPYVLPY